MQKNEITAPIQIIKIKILDLCYIHKESCKPIFIPLLSEKSDVGFPISILAVSQPGQMSCLPAKDYF